MFRPIEAIIRFVQLSYKSDIYIYNVRNCISMVRSQHLLRVGLVYLNLISRGGDHVAAYCVV
jgi:hypothetical protein